MKIGQKEPDEYCDECNVFSDVQKITVARKSFYLCQDCKEVLFVMLCQKNADMDAYTERKREDATDDVETEQPLRHEMVV